MCPLALWCSDPPRDSRHIFDENKDLEPGNVRVNLAGSGHLVLNKTNSNRVNTFFFGGNYLCDFGCSDIVISTGFTYCGFTCSMAFIGESAQGESRPNQEI